MKKEIMEKIFHKCNSLQMSFNDKGYVNSNEKNLVEIFDNWKEIRQELANGQGNELKPDKNGIIKFNAVHSSAALAVNNFAILKKQKNKITFLNFSNFNRIQFEKKLPTGISTPNLDVYFETNYETIGVESKFTEFLTPKLPNAKGNLSKYLNNKKLQYLPPKFNSELIEYYVNVTDKMYLDVAQLIKHGIGIINKAQNRYKFILNALISQPILVYIYWQPLNWYNFNLFRKHNDEIIQFQKRVKPFLTFIPISYLDFWRLYENDRNFGELISKLKERYLIEI